MRRVAAATVALALSACIDARTPFEATDRDPVPADHVVYQLTYSPDDDRAPAWSADSRLVHYSAENYDGQAVRGALATVRGDGLGPALPTFTGVPRFPWLLAPAEARDGSQRIAYVEMFNTLTGACGGLTVPMSCSGAPWQNFPIVIEVRLRVRSPAQTGSIGDDPVLPLPLGSHYIDTERERSGQPVEVVDYQPWHTLFVTEGTWGLRPDWSPAGDRVAFSDGLRLRLWDPADPHTTVEIPGTADGISPAWSPDGEWIAYTRLLRGPSTFGACVGIALGDVVCAVDQTVVNVADRVLVLTRPDGSDEQVLGQGEEPAWGPDGTLYFRRDDRLWRDGDPAEPLPGTVLGREPAVSPDGTRLVFARPNAQGRHDLWVLRLAD